MPAQPLVELFEELKERRRHGEVPHGSFEAALERLPPELAGLEASFRSDPPHIYAERLTRTLSAWIFAERVFGSEDKAADWLNRPNSGMGGQRPVDLLRDELGTAVVRETLEQVDHGIFA